MDIELVRPSCTTSLKGERARRDTVGCTSIHYRRRQTLSAAYHAKGLRRDISGVYHYLRLKPLSPSCQRIEVGNTTEGNQFTV
jgi:hypothetical protein